jgi:zinc/manganese transport system permease protein
VVLKRGIIFIDLAIAQVAALGVIAAGALGWEENIYAVQIAAVGAALLAAAGLNWTEKYWPDIQEALIGNLFVLAATGSILLLAENPHGGEYLKDILVGQILWTTWQMLVPIAILYTILLSVWFTSSEKIGRAGFYVTFAFAITAAVQIVGVYLVFASLILPALATRRLHGKARLMAGYSIGGLSFIAGITLSALLDLPTGAVVVWTMAVVSIMASYLIKHRMRT